MVKWGKLSLFFLSECIYNAKLTLEDAAERLIAISEIATAAVFNFLLRMTDAFDLSKIISAKDWQKHKKVKEVQRSQWIKGQLRFEGMRQGVKGRQYLIDE